MTEAELQERVRAMCRSFGLAVEHVENSLKGRTWLPGMPDLQIFGKRILYRELKDEFENLDTAQTRARYIIQAAGGDWDLWRPHDLRTGRISAELAAIAFSREMK